MLKPSWTALEMQESLMLPYTREYTTGLVVAQSINGVIGVNNTIPWKLSSDMKRFKEITSGHAILMGRKTYESIGRPLSNRVNIVVTSQTNGLVERKGDKFWFIKNLSGLSNMDLQQQIVEEGNKKLYAIGGHAIYKAFIPQCDELHITTVNTVIDSKDAITFPAQMMDLKQYKSIQNIISNKDESKEEHSYIYEKFEKIVAKNYIKPLSGSDAVLPDWLMEDDNEI